MNYYGRYPQIRGGRPQFTHTRGIGTISPQEEPIIFLHALSSISAPRTLKLQGYIKHRKVVVLVDNGNAQNFNHKRVLKETRCYVHPVSSLQIMVANGGMMKCGSHCENV